MTDTPEPSDDPADKLQACLSHDWVDPDDDLGAVYRQACSASFAGLPELLRDDQEAAVALCVKSDESAAAGFAAELPPAPMFPLA